MDWRDRISTNPEVMVGKPVVGGTRLTVEFLVELIKNGWSESQVLDGYRGLTAEDLSACLAFDAESQKAEA